MTSETVEPHRTYGEGASTVRKWALSSGLDATHADVLVAAVTHIKKHLDTRSVRSDWKITQKADSGTIQVDISFPSHLIPTVTHDETEVPTWLAGELSGIDRVFLGRQERCKVIRLVMYQRRKGHADEPWFMSLSPGLKHGVCTSASKAGKDKDGAESVLEDVETGKVLRLGSVAGFIVSRLNGSTPLMDIYLEVVDKFGLTAPNRVRALYLALERNGMLDNDPGQIVSHTAGKKLRNLVEQGIVFRRSNDMLGTLLKGLGPLVGMLGVVLLTVLGVSGVLTLLTDGGRFLTAFRAAGPYMVHHPWILVFLYTFVFLATIMHELGHGLTCRHFGGRVDRMGFMLYLVMFIFFCDVSSAWGMKSRRHRIMISLGGPLVTFGILGACLWGFRLFAGTGSGWEAFFAAAVMMEVFVLAMNLNPFLRMDAYYMLEDFLDVYNLRRNSSAFWRGLIRKSDRAGEIAPRHSRRDRLIYIVYGLLGGACTLAFIVLPMYYYSRELLTHNDSAGKIVLAVVMVLLVLIRQGMKLSRDLKTRTHWSREIV